MLLNVVFPVILERMHERKKSCSFFTYNDNYGSDEHKNGRNSEGEGITGFLAETVNILNQVKLK